MPGMSPTVSRLPTTPARAPARPLRRAALAIAAALAGCATEPTPSDRAEPSQAAVRSMLLKGMPAGVADRAGWAADIQAAFGTLQIRMVPEHLCSAIAIIEQESSFRADPSVPGLPAIAWKEIDSRAEQLGIPRFVVRTALLIKSPDGRSYSDRIDAVKTESQLSDIFEDFIGMVPMGKTFFADRNPVRTGGPMQVSIAFAQAHAARKPYPYPIDTSIRQEVFTRRGGVYFGIAHLFDYPAGYDRTIYRFADFNAGHYASRNAAFQNAVTIVSGVPLTPDGDLIRYGDAAARGPGATESALRAIAGRLGQTPDAIRRDLEQGKTRDFERSTLYRRVFELAEQREGKPLPRAALPRIALQSPKITRPLTTEWFATRVDERRKRCLARIDTPDT
ncbi:MAG: DUF1615 domain-containing protein [Burkholderiaceae bacterium]